MADCLTKERRSWNMSRIRGKNTAPEKRVRSILHRLGHRFRIHDRQLPGHPDIVLPKYKTVLFIHGCFWHRHEGCKNSTTPSSNKDFWIKKLEANVVRDKVHRRRLQKLGWSIVVVWECATEDVDKLRQLQRRLDRHLELRMKERASLATSS